MDTNDLLTGGIRCFYTRRPVDNALIKPWNRVEDQPMGRLCLSKRDRLSFTEEALSNCVNYPEGSMIDETRAPNLRYLCNEIRSGLGGNSRGCMDFCLNVLLCL